VAASLRRAVTTWVLMGVLGAGCDGYVEGGPKPLPAPSDGPPTQAPVDAGSEPPVGGSDGGADAGPHMLFVAVGYGGRTTVSCDDGRSWTADRSDMPDLRCSGPLPDGGSMDCDHDPGAGRGLAAGDGWFVANFGWGAPGTIRRSRDGVTWEHVVRDGPTFAAMVYDGRGHFLAASGSPWVSVDAGSSWREGGDPKLDGWAVRRGGFGAGVFVLYGDQPPPEPPAPHQRNNWAVSADQGATWFAPESIPPDCSSGSWEGGIEGSEQVVVMLGAAVQGKSVSCRSTDKGRTWTRAEVGGMVISPLLWTGTEFMAWGMDTQSRHVVFRTEDGAAWSATPVRLRTEQADGGSSFSDGPLVGAVARGASGTFVAVNGGWDVSYEKQVFLRSTDGVTWEALPPQRYSPSHPINFIVSGPGLRSSACP